MRIVCCTHLILILYCSVQIVGTVPFTNDTLVYGLADLFDLWWWNISSMNRGDDISYHKVANHSLNACQSHTYLTINIDWSRANTGSKCKRACWKQCNGHVTYIWKKHPVEPHQGYKLSSNGVKQSQKESSPSLQVVSCFHSKWGGIHIFYPYSYQLSHWKYRVSLSEFNEPYCWQ